MPTIDPDCWYTLSALAEVCPWSDTSLRKWCLRGLLRSIRSPGGVMRGDYRVLGSDYLRFLESLTTVADVPARPETRRQREDRAAQATARRKRARKEHAA